MTTSSPARARGPGRQFYVAATINTVFYVVAYGALYFLWPFQYENKDAQARFFHALMLCVGPAVFLYLAFTACLRAFDSEASDRDPMGGHESAGWKINNRVYANSVEQWSMFLPVVLAASVYLPAERFRAVPIAVILWTVGRIMFWVGYRIAPPKRNMGVEFTVFSFLSLLTWMIAVSL